MRRLSTIAAILSVIGLTFWAGYITYPLIQGSSLVSYGIGDVTAAADVELPPGQEAVASRQDAPNLALYWEAWEILERDFFGPKPDTSARLYSTIRGLTDAYDDPYTYFLEPQPRQIERDELRGRFGGIGANVERTDAGYVLHPLIDQPADRAGIRAGDLLLRVDEQEITADMVADDVVARVRGPVDTEVALVVRRTDEQGEDNRVRDLAFTVKRAEIETPSMEWRLLEICDLTHTDTEACVAPEAPSVGYIRHTLFSERSPAEMQVAIEELVQQGASRFILDLRGNPGGLVSSAVAVADLWLDGGPIYIEQRANGDESVVEAQAGEIAEAYGLVVIVDNASASASEIVAGALQDSGRAHLIGQQTFGKGSVQLIHELSDQSSIHVTNAEWYTPHRRRISPDGLTPDIIIDTGADPLPQAIALLTE
jgi:carboxyl-terminal processing protease